jgi:hypothetical protein
MVMIAHQAGDVTAPPLLVDVPAEEPEELLSIRVIEENRLRRIAARREVGEGAGKFQPEWMSYEAGR